MSRGRSAVSKRGTSSERDRVGLPSDLAKVVGEPPRGDLGGLVQRDARRARLQRGRLSAADTVIPIHVSRREASDALSRLVIRILSARMP